MTIQIKSPMTTPSNTKEVKDSADTDEALMAAVSLRDRNAFTKLLNRHLERSVRLAQKVLGNRADADEVVQEAFLRIWTRTETWSPVKSSFSPWFNRIIVNLAIDCLRKRKVQVSLDEIEDLPDTEVEAKSSGEIRRNWIDKALSKLAPRQQTVLQLFYLEEMSTQKVADLLELTLPATESLLARARKALRQLAEIHLHD